MEMIDTWKFENLEDDKEKHNAYRDLKKAYDDIKRVHDALVNLANRLPNY